MEMYKLQRSAMQLQSIQHHLWPSGLQLLFFLLFSNNSSHNFSYLYWIGVNTYGGINKIYQRNQNKLCFQIMSPCLSQRYKQIWRYKNLLFFFRKLNKQKHYNNKKSTCEVYKLFISRSAEILLLCRS